MSSAYSLETIRDENSGSVSVVGNLDLGNLPGCPAAVSSYLQEFGFDPSSGVMDVSGIPVAVATGRSSDGRGYAEAVSNSGALSFGEAELRAAVRYVMEKALEISRFYKAVKSAETTQ